MPRSDWERAKADGCRGTTRTCICGFRDRRPAVRRPGNGGGLRSRPSATESPLALAPRPPASGVNPPKMVGPDGNAPSSLAYRASALLLSYEPIVAESGGLAPQPANRSVCFRGSARALAGSLSKMAESSGPAPQALRLESASNRSPRFAALLSKIWRRREVTLLSGLRPPNPLQTGAGASASFASMVPAAGFAPASVRLEGGGLSYSATRREFPGTHPRQRGALTAMRVVGAREMDLAAGLSPAMPRPKRGVIYLSLREENGPFTRTCTSISSFARSRPSFWTMKGKRSPAAAGLRQKTKRRQPSRGTASTSRTSASGSRSSFCMISNTRSLQPARQKTRS